MQKDSVLINSAPPEQQFGIIEWVIQEKRLILCPYLSELIAFKTKDVNQLHAEWMTLDHPDDVGQVNLHRVDLISGRAAYIFYESRKLCRDGNWRWFRVRGKIIEFDSESNPIRAFVTCTEITKTKEMELKLQKIELLYNEINKIKAYENSNTSFEDISSKILDSLKELTRSSDATLFYSSINISEKYDDGTPHLYNKAGIDIYDLMLPANKLNFINKLFAAQSHIIQNNEGTSYFGIFLDLPFQQKGMIILEDNKPFEDTLIAFLSPLIGTANHIISIKKLEINRSELDNMLSFFIKQVPVPVAMFDTNMCYKFASDAWLNDFNLGKAENIIGKTTYELSPKQPAEWRERHQRALQGEIIESSAEEILDYYDEPIWLEGAIHPWYTLNGDIGGVIIYSNVVTERKKTEKDLKTTVTNLLKSNQALERFAHVCSHDLKEPLRSVANFIHLLFNRNTNYFDEESLLYMRHTLKGIDRMNTLIKDILTYSKVAGQMSSERDSFDMNDVIQSIQETLEFRISEIGAHIEVCALPIISGDRTQITQLFTNLIDNALKFCAEKKPRIEIYAIESSGFWEFHVRDNGIGIEKEYHKSIFTMFKRLHSKNQFEGSGIGLATCQKIVENHFGEIYVKSALDGGSEFIVTLPKTSI